MKTLRYLLITFAVMMSMHIANATAQSLATEPQYGFQSTSSMAGSGSTLPQAAAEGAYTTCDEGSGIARNNNSGIRRWGDEGGSGEPGDRPEPYESPIGEGIWALLALAAGYAVFRIRRKCVERLKG